MVDSCRQEDSFYRTDRLDYIFRYRRNHTIAALLSIVYQLDAIRTVHRTAVTKGWCFPSFTNDSKFYAVQFLSSQVKDAVANDWEMENGNICIFTGSNMAGKSTTLKAIASAVMVGSCRISGTGFLDGLSYVRWYFYFLSICRIL